MNPKAPEHQLILTAIALSPTEEDLVEHAPVIKAGL